MSKPIFRGWFVVAACFLCMLISGGVGWFTFPVFMPPIKEEFGWMDLELGLAVALWAAVGAVFCFALLSGLCAGGRATLWPLVVSDCFGSRAYSSILGFLVIFYNLGAVGGPPVAGRISDVTGSFYGVFVLSVAAHLVSCVLMALGAKPRLPEAPQGEPHRL